MFASKYDNYLQSIGYNDYIYNSYKNDINFDLNSNNSYYSRDIENITNSRKENLEEVIKLIRNSINDENEDEEFYLLLLSQAMYEEDKEIIKSIIEDEKNHDKILREIYNEFTGNIVSNSRTSSEEENINMYYMNLRKAMFGELAAIEKYRSIMAKMPDMKNYSKIMEIMTDEIKHAIKYNYLISKNRI